MKLQNIITFTFVFYLRSRTVLERHGFLMTDDKLLNKYHSASLWPEAHIEL